MNSKTKKPKVSIVILNWNQKEDTIECLNSLKNLKYPNYSIILVDNGSSDGSLRTIQNKFPNINLIRNSQNLGFTGGCNVGMKKALKNGSKYIFLLNNDAIIDKFLLQELVKVSEKSKKIGIAGPKICSYNKPNRLLSAGQHINLKKGETTNIGRGMEQRQHTKVADVDYVQGSAMLIKKEVLERIGLFYEPYFIYFEDAELCLRAKKAGYKIVYVPKAKIWHKVSKTFGPMSPKAFYYYSRNRITFVMRNGKLTDKILFSLYLSLIYTPLTIGYCLLHKKFNLINAYSRGVFRLKAPK